MVFQKATLADLPSIMKIITQAQEYLRVSGIDQWQNGYPSEDVIRKDIEQGNSYVLTRDGVVLATAVLEFGGDPNYAKIYDGAWSSAREYGAIHRIAVMSDQKGRGLANRMLSSFANLCLQRGVHSLRVDTHRDNRSMQQMLLKNGFEYCGIIFLADGSPRVAFERVLVKE